VQDASGQVLFYAPVSSGSDHDPLPLGDWKVLDVFLMPRFNYNPDLFWDADPKHAKTKIAPGPNNPVGVVWISLDREHYGLHGTPEPSKIGITQSHGCVRLTNWDALVLARRMTAGTPVVFRGTRTGRQQPVRPTPAAPAAPAGPVLAGVRVDSARAGAPALDSARRDSAPAAPARDSAQPAPAVPVAAPAPATPAPSPTPTPTDSAAARP
jgi:hypothetical protein